MLFRKVFFQSFDEELDAKNFPKEINIKNIANIEDISLDDLSAVQKVMNGTC